jgi:glutamine cyclotransferase
VDVGPGGEIVGGLDAVWFDDSFGNITRVDPRTNDVVGEAHLSTSNVGGIAVSSDAVWATAVDQGLVWEIDPQKMQAIDSYRVGADPLGVAVGAGSTWIANAGGTLTRLDPSTGKTTTIRLAGSPDGVAFADKLIWIGID